MPSKTLKTDIQNSSAASNLSGSSSFHHLQGKLYKKPNKELPPLLIKQLEKCTSLPSLPAVAIKVINLAKQPTAGTVDLAHIIEADPSLSAKILSAANSSYYTTGSFNSLQQAINRLGMETSLALALSFSLVRIKSKTKGLDLDRYWKRAAISGLVVRELNKISNLSFDIERVYLAAILQDIGMLALNEIQPAAYKQLCLLAKNHLELAHLEEEKFGASHLSVGYWLGNTWSLPSRFNKLILASHTPAQQINNSRSKHNNLRVLAFAGLVADTWLHTDRKLAMTLAYQASQSYLNLTEHEFNHLLLQVQEKLPEIARLFELSMPKKIDPFKLLQEAQQLLVERNLSLMQKLAKQESELASLSLESKQLQKQLNKDSLTGTHNRQYIKQQLDLHFKEVQKTQGVLSAVFIDLDFFKQINDGYGHAVGDEVLIAFATKLKQLTPKGCFAGRYGGEEFVVLLPNNDLANAKDFALELQKELAALPLLIYEKKTKKIIHVKDLQQIENLNPAQEEKISISASIGLAEYDPNQETKFAKPDDLVNAADQAMYDAKRTGRNRIMLFTAEGSKTLQ